MLEPGPALLRLLRTPVPDKLYHYTSLTGLDGIASSKAVWASVAQYLNDAKEFRLAIEIARRQIASVARQEVSPGRTRLLTYLHDQLERVEGFEVCIFSLTREGDLLSQWRGYCPANGGYSIGFAGDELRAVMAPQGGMLVPCEYDTNLQELLIQESLAPILSRLPADAPEEEAEFQAAAEMWIGPLFSQLSFVAPLVKHYSFAEEREWRLIWIPGRIEGVGLRYRAGRGTYIPYVPLSLEHGGRSVSFDEVIIGPMPHQRLAGDAASGALHQHGMHWRSLRHSQVPFRTL